MARTLLDFLRRSTDIVLYLASFITVFIVGLLGLNANFSPELILILVICGQAVIAVVLIHRRNTEIAHLKSPTADVEYHRASLSLTERWYINNLEKLNPKVQLQLRMWLGITPHGSNPATLEFSVKDVETDGPFEIGDPHVKADFGSERKLYPSTARQPIDPVGTIEKYDPEASVSCYFHWSSPKKVESRKRRYTQVGRTKHGKHTTAIHEGIQAGSHSAV